MLSRNSNISSNKLGAPKGRKIDNTVNLHITNGTHGFSQDQQKKSQDFDQPIHMQVAAFKKPSKSIHNKNKENMDTNLPIKRSLHKAQSTKSMTKIKKSMPLTKSMVGCKKGDSARSSLSKRSRSQTNLAGRKQHQNRKSLSPKTHRPVTSRLTKPLLSQRDPKTTKPKEVNKKKEHSVNNSKNIKKKPKIHPESHIILNDSSIEVARELQNMHKTLTKTKKSLKRIPVKQDKKVVIISENISKHRPIESERDSPDMNVLSHKYRGTKKDNINFLKPASRNNVSKNKRQHIAAIIIQRAFRSYKQIQEDKNIQKIMLSIIKIQRWWRNQLRVKHSSEIPRLVGESSLVTIQDFSYEFEAKKTRKLNIELSEDVKDQSIKERIKYLLEDNDSNISSNKFIETKKISFSPRKKEDSVDLPLKLYSPKSVCQPDVLVENLSNLQKLHKQKLVKTFNHQRQAIVKLWEQKLCSPRTQQGKLQQLDERLNKQLSRFEAGIKQVLRGMSLAKCDMIEQSVSQQYNAFRSPTKLTYPENPFDHYNEVTNTYPEKNEAKESKQIKQISEIEIQLSFKDDQTQFKFDSGMQAIKIYINCLHTYLIQVPGWNKYFLQSMTQFRGITIPDIFAGLEEIEQDDSSHTFRLPKYKQFVDTNPSIIQSHNVEEFNKQYSYQRTKNNIEFQGYQGFSTNVGMFEYYHIQAVVDTLNDELHKQRPINSLNFKKNKNQIHKLEEQTIEKWFTDACDEVLQNTQLLCGFIDDTNQLQQGSLSTIRQSRLKHMILLNIKQQLQLENLDPEQVQVKAELSEVVAMNLIQETVIQLYQIIYS